MNKALALALPAVLLLLSTGCATITRGSTEAWTVTSDPLGAHVRLSTGQTCITPCTLELKRKHGFDVTVEHDGYNSVATQVVSQVGGAGAAGMAGNVLFGGIVGVVVDANTGSTRDLQPNPLVLALVPASDAQAVATGVAEAPAGAEVEVPSADTAGAAEIEAAAGAGAAPEA